MKKVLPFLAIAAACGACLAVPLLLPVLVGLAASGVGATLLGWEVGSALLAGVLVVVAVLWARRARRAQLGRVARQSETSSIVSPGSR